MKKTVEVAADRAENQNETVLPNEYARGVYIQNAPSLKALKLMHLMIGCAGAKMADDVRHNVPLSEVNNIDGMTRHSKVSLKPLFEELRATVITYDEPEENRYTVGGLLDHAIVDFKTEDTGEVLISWQFGQMFKDMAAVSKQWAILDRQIIFHFSSKYSILLFQHISSLVRLKYAYSKRFKIPELRALFGIEAGNVIRFADVNKRIIKPSIAEVNKLSDYNLTATAIKQGRTVIAVEISWEPKPKLEPKPVNKRTASPLKSVKPIGGVTPVKPAKAFPKTGSIEFSKPWNAIAKLNGNGKDKDLIAQDFRNWCDTKGIPLDGPTIEGIFTGFCKQTKL